MLCSRHSTPASSANRVKLRPLRSNSSNKASRCSRVTVMRPKTSRFKIFVSPYIAIHYGRSFTCPLFSFEDDAKFLLRRRKGGRVVLFLLELKIRISTIYEAPRVGFIFLAHCLLFYGFQTKIDTACLMNQRADTNKVDTRGCIGRDVIQVYSPTSLRFHFAIYH